MFTLAGMHSWYQVKENNMRQQYSMNIDFKDIDLGQYVIRTFKDDYNYSKNYYRLQLKQVYMGKDLTGEYKVLQNVEEWGVKIDQWQDMIENDEGVYIHDVDENSLQMEDNTDTERESGQDRFKQLEEEG